jgi:hypothetical protein
MRAINWTLGFLGELIGKCGLVSLLILLALSGCERTEYEMKVNYSGSPDSLLRLAGDRSADTTDLAHLNNCLTQGVNMSTEVRFVLFKIPHGSILTSDSIEALMKGEGLVPAMDRDLLALAAVYPDLQRTHQIVALEIKCSYLEREGGDGKPILVYHVLEVNGDRNNRSVFLTPDYQWDNRTVFLAKRR